MSDGKCGALPVPQPRKIPTLLLANHLPHLSLTFAPRSQRRRELTNLIRHRARLVRKIIELVLGCVFLILRVEQLLLLPDESRSDLAFLFFILGGYRALFLRLRVKRNLCRPCLRCIAPKSVQKRDIGAHYAPRIIISRQQIVNRSGLEQHLRVAHVALLVHVAKSLGELLLRSRQLKLALVEMLDERALLVSEFCKTGADAG